MKQHPQGLTSLTGWVDGEGYSNLSLRLPARVAKKLGHLKGGLFSCELTDEGILFRLIQQPSENDGASPNWVKP